MGARSPESSQPRRRSASRRRIQPRNNPLRSPSHLVSRPKKNGENLTHSTVHYEQHFIPHLSYCHPTFALALALSPYWYTVSIFCTLNTWYGIVHAAVPPAVQKSSRQPHCRASLDPRGVPGYTTTNGEAPSSAVNKKSNTRDERLG